MHRRRSRTIWSGRRPWTGCCAATWALARPRWPCGRPSNASPTPSSAPCWCPPPSWPGSTTRPLRERMEGFPVNVELLSRFRTPQAAGGDPAEAAARGRWTWSSAPTGWCSKDVKFQDLGLVIIDEEQRFGVAQKEKLEADVQQRRRADPLRHAHPPHAEYGPVRHPGHVRH